MRCSPSRDLKDDSGDFRPRSPDPTPGPTITLFSPRSRWFTLLSRDGSFIAGSGRRQSMLAASTTLMTSTMQQQFGILSRTPKRFLAAQNEQELRETLGLCLRGLFRRLSQFE